MDTGQFISAEPQWELPMQNILRKVLNLGDCNNIVVCVGRGVHLSFCGHRVYVKRTLGGGNRVGVTPALRPGPRKSRLGAAEMNPISNHEDAGLIPGLAQ